VTIFILYEIQISTSCKSWEVDTKSKVCQQNMILTISYSSINSSNVIN